jgi:hypothetical protein
MMTDFLACIKWVKRRPGEYWTELFTVNFQKDSKNVYQKMYRV